VPFRADVESRFTTFRVLAMHAGRGTLD
jgi:hypothetical protein